MEALGGPPTPAVGWAAGIERLAMLIDAPAPEVPVAMLVPLGEAAEVAAMGVLADLRRSGIAADMNYSGNMKKRMARADKAGARYAIIIGESEVASGMAQLKELKTGEQREVAFDQLAEALR